MSVLTPLALALVRTAPPHALGLVLVPAPSPLYMSPLPSWISAIIVRIWSLVFVSPPSWILAIIV